jgi:penicillin-binding protein 2
LASDGRRSRRFLPADPRVQEPYRLTPQLAFRVAILGALALTVFAVLFLRLWALQVLAGDRYLAAANDNRVRIVRIDAPRGLIVDRDGKVIVDNVAGSRVELWPADLPKSWPEQRRELRAVSRITGVPVHQILRRMNKQAGDPLTPVVVQYGIHADQISYLKEHRVEFPGVRVTDSYLRKYPYQSLLAHVVGYTGEISEEQLKARRRLGYRLGDIVGQTGIEATYDRYLRGHPGSAQLTVDSRGRPTSPSEPRVSPRRGNALRLTIDIDLQRAAERAITDGIRLARADGRWAADGGAIVALDPRDGSVLALASNPTYQPSIFVGRPDREKLARLLDRKVAEEANYPGLDRALAVDYPPGSTFKPVTALAALQEHLIRPHDSIPCTPDYKAYEQTFLNWTPDISTGMDLITAIAASCDTYFYRIGDMFYGLPPDRGHPLQNWASRFGLGVRTGIDIGGESSGLIPTPEWRCRHFGGPPCKGYVDRTWKPGYSIQMAIGQGDVTVTPIQMTRFYAMIANGGKLVTPHVVEDVEQPTSDPRTPHVLRRFASQPPQPSGVDPSALADVQQGLFAATHSSIGTGVGVFGHFPIPIAGKTGTADKIMHLADGEVLPQAQSWWCGYAPYDNPTLTVCAVIENGGHGGTAAAPAALQVFESYFGKHATTTTHASD